MIRTVKKGRARFLPFFPFINLSKSVTKTVIFTESCRYDLGDEDQGDWNKLFGIGFFPHHHKNSYRFSWRYNPIFKEIELGTYSYVNGVLSSTTSPASLIPIGKKIKLTIEYRDGFVLFMIGDKYRSYTTERCDKWPLISFKLGPYFGGNEKAPNKIKIDLSW